jgi:hypothetical protein
VVSPPALRSGQRRETRRFPQCEEMA